MGSVSIVSEVLVGCVSVGATVLVIGVLVVVGCVVETAGNGADVVLVVSQDVLLVLLPQEIKSIKSKINIRKIVIFFTLKPPLIGYRNCYILTSICG